MSKIYKQYEINEQHEIAFFFREFECWMCAGSGVFSTFFEGNDYEEECEDCGGVGMIYLRDARPCKFCGTKIYFEKQNEKYVPLNAYDDEPHKCLESHSMPS